MIYISHRGNIDGPNPKLENNPTYIEKALGKGYNVEIDVWLIGEYIYLGHDCPGYWVESTFLTNEGLWCHAKNIEALHYMVNICNINCFWHQSDTVTLTSHNFLWTYPGNALLTDRSIAVLPEMGSWDISQLKGCYGVCTDYISNYVENHG